MNKKYITEEDLTPEEEYKNYWNSEDSCNIVSHLWELKMDNELKKIIDYEKTITPNINGKTGLHLFIFSDRQVYFLKGKNRQDLLNLLFNN